MNDSPAASPPRPTVLDGWLTRAELSRQIGLSVNTLAKWATRGTGPTFIRIGSTTYYRLETVAAWLVTLEDQAKPRFR